MTISADAIQDSVSRHLSHLVSLRQSLHQIPEVGLAERKTCALLRTELLEIGLHVQDDFGTAGLIADINPAADGDYVMLRADIDGLPVIENSGVPHHSRHCGFAHCCGHDGHATCLVGAARVLHDLRDVLKGRVRLVFQAAEEISRGALELIEAGLFRDGLPKAIFALHAWPGLPVGAIACKPGAMMAASDSFTITVLGQGGHGARPHLARNPLLGVARLAEILNAMTTRERVVSPCIVRTGEKNNVIADSGIIAGTVRTLSEDSRQATFAEMRQRSQEACRELGLKVNVAFETGCPSVLTDPQLYGMFQAVGERLFGAAAAHRLQASSMGSEDFGYYLAHAPGLMFRLGMGEESPELHNAKFDFNDAAIPCGVSMLAGLAVQSCNGAIM